MITGRAFLGVVKSLEIRGYARDDINWSKRCKMPRNADIFANEVIFVICNSGMKHSVAQRIFWRVMEALKLGQPVGSVFGHTGKAQAIEYIWRDRKRLVRELRQAARDSRLLEFCGSLPWIGDITKYHVAKNFGAQVAKPDVHLQRLADRENVTPQRLCERLAKQTGYKVATVDVLLWRACAVGVIDSRTGVIIR